MLLSIIIPTYNVENYISKCLISCTSQNISSELYEIIVVNDGSTDHSLDIASEFAQSHINVQIISQENQGLSMARNTGLKEAKGKYIWFIDSDDYIDENCLGELIKFMDDGMDIIQIQQRHVFSNNSPSIEQPQCHYPYGVSGLRTLELGILCVPAPFSIYRREYLLKNNLSFTKGIYHEDCEFKPRAMFFAQKVCSTNIVCYNYLQRSSGSITSTFKIKRGEDIVYVINSLINFCNSHTMPNKCKRTIYNLCSTLVNTLLSGLMVVNKEEKEYLVRLLKENNHIFKHMLMSLKAKYIIEGVILSTSVNLGVYLYKFLK